MLRTESTGALSRGRRFLRRIDVVELATHHHRDETVAVEVRRPMGADDPAVLDDSHPVGNAEHFLQPMGDVDDADALVAKLRNPLEQEIRLPPGNDGGRFVENEQPGAADQSLGDLDHLPVGNAQSPDGRGRIEFVAEARENFCRLLAHRPAIDRPQRSAWRGAEIDILGDAQLRKQHKFLVDDVDAGFLGLPWRGPAPLCAVVMDGSGIRRMGAGDHLDQRRLPGAVLADQRVDFAGVCLEIDRIQRLYAGKCLRDAAQDGSWPSLRTPARESGPPERSRRSGFGRSTGHAGGNGPFGAQTASADSSP